MHFNNFGNDFPSSFDKEFKNSEKFIKKAFGFVILTWIVGAILSVGFIGAVIYFLVKLASTL